MTFISSLKRMGSSHLKLSYKEITARCRGKKLRLQVADTFRKLATGLMNHTGLDENQGMLFIFGREGRLGFWMLNMKMSIDIIWLDKDRRVVHIWKKAVPCKSIFSCQTVRPKEKALYVIELKAGAATKMGIKIGDKFSW